VPSRDLISAMDPLVNQLGAQVDHRTPAHLSAMLRDTGDNLRLQLFADVQAKAQGPVLELVLMSREPMGRGAPHTHATVPPPGGGGCRHHARSGSGVPVRPGWPPARSRLNR
ncbi:MAG: hypothetical protein WCH37_11135, partial [Synechococcaceae cyanobacterium ELA182]